MGDTLSPNRWGVRHTPRETLCSIEIICMIREFFFFLIKTVLEMRFIKPTDYYLTSFRRIYDINSGVETYSFCINESCSRYRASWRYPSAQFEIISRTCATRD